MKRAQFTGLQAHELSARESDMEMITSWEIAVFLGAELPKSIEEHRAMRRDGNYVLVRARETSLALYWRLDNELTARSS